MKKNNKGFTLIELLAVIVILSVIMVIAIPRVLNTISNSKTKAWDNNVKMIRKAIETNIAISNTAVTTGFSLGTGLCPATTAGKDIESDATFAKAVSLDATNTKVNCKSSGTTYTFTLTGAGNFNGKTATITCSSSTFTCN